MDFEICNPSKDQYGNSKENIFLAFHSNGKYLGSAYAYPSINHYQTYETPYLIFIDVMVESNDDNVLCKEVRQELFHKVYARTKELRRENLDLRARIYSGFQYDEEMLNFYLDNGFNEDYSIIMEADIIKDSKYVLPKNITVIDCKTNTEEDFIKYKKIYDNIFVTPIDINMLKEQENYNGFKNLYFLIEGKVQGGCTVFEKDGFGYIETIYVMPEFQGKGMSKIIINYIIGYFLSLGLEKTRLEVWRSNERAVKVYKSFGYKEIEKNLMFPYIIM